ncbi:MAG: dTDP-4-dehydrorhamnose reductase [Bradyrhizobium sp.]|nr:dTDP-4-dehydrorhamnose reductase [Bradyrhizobium sp.]
MRIVVTGREGQLARALAERGGELGHEMVLLGRPEFELTSAPAVISAVIAAARPDVIVSAAAYTAVDRAESEPGLAFAVNADGAEAVALAAREIGAPLVHLSTDYVFDGTNPRPYVEGDLTGPRSVYGASKLAGEQRVAAAYADCVVLRTAWVFSPFGHNFVRTMLRLAETRPEIGVVRDQCGNPTSAFDIADAVIAVAGNLAADRDPRLRGLFHLTSPADASWAEFAARIFALSAMHGGPAASVRPITTADYPTPALRPANSRLDSALILAQHGIRLADWHDSVAPVVARLLAQATS